MKNGDKRRRTDSEAVPAYQALAAELRERIISGEFPPERKLPTEAELAFAHDLSRQTVRQAFAELVAESLVYRVAGRGTFATPSFSSPPGAYLKSMGSVDDLLALSIDTQLEVIKPLQRLVDVEAAARLQLSNDEVSQIVFRRLHHHEPFFYTTTSLPVSVGQELSGISWLNQQGARSADTMIGLIERQLGSLRIAGARQSVTAVDTPNEIAPMIDREAGSPALRFDRIYFTREGSPVEFSVTYANPARYAYRLELRRSR
jgi:GntR family transcriptional regulator